MQEYFRLMAMNYYDSVDMTNYNKELDRALIVKKAFKKYYKNNYLNLRLTLNHIIILYNFFPNFATDILFHVVPEEHQTLLNTFLLFLNRLPIDKKDIIIDTKIQGELQKL
jgi:hypothetical protein